VGERASSNKTSRNAVSADIDPELWRCMYERAVISGASDATKEAARSLFSHVSVMALS